MLKGDLPSSLEGIDTGILFDLFRRHRLFPLAPPLFPLLDEEERERWKKAVQTRTIRSMHQITVLNQVIESLQEGGIEAFPLKGPVLAYTLYGNMSERHSSDLDILVLKTDIHRIIEIFASVGFELRYPKKGLTERQWNYYLKYKKDIGLFSKEHGLIVELHFHIENYFGLNDSFLEQLVQQPEEVILGGAHLKILNSHQTFLYLALHGAVHQYRRLFWLRDIAAVLNRWELDHTKIIEDAKSIGIERMVGVSVELAGELFGVELPSAYLSCLKENKKPIEKMKQFSMGVILGPEFPTMKGKLGHHLFMLRSKPELIHYFRTTGEILNRLYIGRFLGGH
jgi:hypothetical protein